MDTQILNHPAQTQVPSVDIPAAVRGLHAFSQKRTAYPVSFRQDQLKALKRAIETRERDIFDALRADLGKPPMEAYMGEIGFVYAEIDYALRHLKRWARPQRRPTPPAAWPGRTYLYPEPYGVALIIGPWNYPFQLLLTPLVAALAAGNCACLKPSELAPHTSAAVAALIKDTFPADYVAVVEGGRETSEALLAERFDFIFFTGSTAVGRSVMQAAAKNLTPVALELGGKSPCIVCPDADLEVAVRRILWGKCMNAGQTCVAPDYVLVHRDAKDALIENFKRILPRFYGENPRQSPDYGRIVNRRHFDRLLAHLSQGKVAVGGDHNADDLYIAPTVLTDVSPESPVMQEEIFGPILPVLTYDNLDAVLEELRTQPKPLALYLFTNERDIQEKVCAGTSSGGVCVNDTLSHMMGRGVPFGGVGESGMGAYHGKAGFDCFTHYKTVMRRSTALDPSLRYPPFALSLNTFKKIYRYLIGR